MAKAIRSKYFTAITVPYVNVNLYADQYNVRFIDEFWAFVDSLNIDNEEGGAWKYRRPKDLSKIVFSFRNIDHAMLFKMKFGGAAIARVS